MTLTTAARLDRIEQGLRLGTGYEPCPCCHGTGLDGSADLLADLDALIAALLARFPTLPDNRDAPRPTAPVRCRVCDGSGRATIAAAADHTDRLTAMLDPLCSMLDRPRT